MSKGVKKVYNSTLDVKLILQSIADWLEPEQAAQD